MEPFTIVIFLGVSHLRSLMSPAFKFSLDFTDLLPLITNSGDPVHRRTAGLALTCVCLCASQITLLAQDFKLFDRKVQVHGFVSQGFVYTNDNNWLTMDTSDGSAAFTDFGLNLSSQLTDKLRVGAQVYDRNLGQLDQYHPSLDWAVADYRLRSWFGVRGGKVKTTLGLYNDTQDLDFLRTFALLPQSVYATDLRETTIAHLGGDLYGNIALRHHLGDLSYTAYGGHRSDSIQSGYPYFLTQYGIYLHSLGGPQYGIDLRWNTPLKGLQVGASRLNQDITGRDTVLKQYSRADWTNQFYGQYAFRKLHIDAEYRRYLRDQIIVNDASELLTDSRGWYVSATYRTSKRLDLGSYYSRYTMTQFYSGPLTALYQNQTDTSLPGNHIYDRVITARFDLTKFWNVKVEGHFMNGYVHDAYPEGFYPQVNPSGFKDDTHALVLKTSLYF